MHIQQWLLRQANISLRACEPPGWKAEKAEVNLKIRSVFSLRSPCPLFSLQQYSQVSSQLEDLDSACLLYILYLIQWEELFCWFFLTRLAFIRRGCSLLSLALPISHDVWNQCCVCLLASMFFLDPLSRTESVYSTFTFVFSRSRYIL